MSFNVHQIAQLGFGTGTNEHYDRARPSYRPAALSHIRNAVRNRPPLNIIEIGSGTGIFTRALLAHPEWESAVRKLRAVEPSEGMRQQFSKTIQDGRVSVHEGTFDTTGIEGGWADVVIIAQAFHWCPDYDKASREFARVLKPNGVVAFIWNLEDRDAAAWVAQVRDRIEKHENGTPQFRLGLWRATFTTSGYTANFEPPEEEIWAYDLLGTEKIVVDRACSKSYIATLTEEDRQKAVADIKTTLERGDGLVWTDKERGEFAYPYKTYVIIARKK